MTIYPERKDIEKMALVIHAVERAESVNILHYGSRIIVYGSTQSGIACIELLKSRGYDSIVAIDSSRKRLALARQSGAEKMLCANELTDPVSLQQSCYRNFCGNPADIIFCFDDSLKFMNHRLDQCVKANGGICFAGETDQMFLGVKNTLFQELMEKEVVILQSIRYTEKDYSKAKMYIQKFSLFQIS